MQLAKKFRERKELLKAFQGKPHTNVEVSLHEEEALQFYQEDLTFWIDPLDATHAFKNGQLDQVTSIIGVSMKNRPKIGIIHHPFYKTFHGIKESKTYLGSVETGLYYSDIRDYMDDWQLYDIDRSVHYVQPFQP